VCEEASDGETALAMVKAARAPYAFVLMDNDMGAGKMKGPTATGMIKKICPSTPVYGYTINHDSLRTDTEFINAGAGRVFTKPLTVDAARLLVKWHCSSLISPQRLSTRGERKTEQKEKTEQAIGDAQEKEIKTGKGEEKEKEETRRKQGGAEGNSNGHVSHRLTPYPTHYPGHPAHTAHPNSCVIGIDAGCCINEWNEKAAAVTGFSADDVIGELFVDHCASNEASAVDHSVQVKNSCDLERLYLGTSVSVQVY